MVGSVAWAGAGLSSLSWGGMRYPLLRFFMDPRAPFHPSQMGSSTTKTGRYIQLIGAAV